MPVTHLPFERNIGDFIYADKVAFLFYQYCAPESSCEYFVQAAIMGDVSLAFSAGEENEED